MEMTADVLNEQQEKVKPANKDHFIGGSFLLLVVIGISTLIYSTFSWMSDAQRLPLSRLMVEGNLQHVTPQMVQKALADLPNIGTFMTQDVDELQTAIKTIPWVAQVSIRKQWKDVIKVYIVEHKVSAIWNGNSLLNTKGEVFNGLPSDVEYDIVNLYGPEGSSQKVLKIWEQSSKKLRSLGRRITSVVLNERLSWQIILDNGIRLELGKNAQGNRLNRFIKLYGRLGDKVEQISYIDLRYDTGAAIGWISDDLTQREK